MQEPSHHTGGGFVIGLEGTSKTTKGAKDLPNAKRKKIADKSEILEYLTNVMRSDEVTEKERLAASFKLGRYLGLEGKPHDEPTRVVIYDGKQPDKLP